MKVLNLETKFNENLRDYAVNPDDFKQALSELELKLFETSDSEKKIILLGKIGTHQRLLGFLNEAEISFEKAVSLADTSGQTKLKLANLVRLGNTTHWKENYAGAHQIFDKCFEIIAEEHAFNEYLDFVYQHKGKCYFDEGKYELALKNFFEAILLRNNKSDTSLADSSLLAIEETKRRWLPQVPQSEIQKILENKNIPNFVSEVFGKKHGQELAPARLNCINAALNFHGISKENPFKPMELLQFLCKNTEQMFGREDYQFGDLVVWWNRSGGTWDNRKIVIKDMGFEDSDFPYGLTFDHVAVRVTPDIVFNKPNPSPDSEYRFDYLDSASYPSKLGKGHELTIHRVKNYE